MPSSEAPNSAQLTSITATKRKQLAALISIAAISIVSYLPAVRSAFISDDFDLFVVIETAEKNPLWFFETMTEFFRFMSFVYFGACYWLFGLNPEPYYWAGIALHAIVSILVYILVRQQTGSALGAWTAGLFFAAYERHHEAVMWISAANETILALNCVVFLLLWRRAAEQKSRGLLVLAHVVFTVALFSKEASVVMVPLAALQLLLAGYSVREVLRRCAVLIMMLFAFLFLSLAVAPRNQFLIHGYYAFGPQFIPVYSRSLLRLLTQLAVPGAVWIIVQFRRFKRNEATALKAEPACGSIGWQSPAIFFAAFLILAILPYSFLTYLNHIPSRHTYLPSIGLAGLFGMVFASLYAQAGNNGRRHLCTSFLCLIVAGNIGYLWLKKVPQFSEREAPTSKLIELLNSPNLPPLPMKVCRFPLDEWVFSETVKRFTPLNTNDVALVDTCEGASGTVMRWDDHASQYRDASLSLTRTTMESSAE